MKSKYLVLAGAACFGLLFWFTDAVIGYLWFYEATFWELLATDVPAHELFARLAVLVCFLVFGLLMSTLGSARHRAEETLRRTNETLNGILEAAPLPIFALDLDGNVRHIWNPAAERVLGWKKEEVLGLPLPTIPPDGQEEFARLRERVRSGETLSDIEAQRQRRDGSPILYGVYAAPLRDAGGEVVGSVSTLLDLSERDQVEQALRESEERFRRLSEATLEGVLIHDQGAILEANQSLATMCGYEPAELPGMNALDDLVASESRDLVRKHIRAGYEEAYEAVGLRKDGSTFPIELEGKQIIYAGRRVRVTAVRDITARKQHEEERQHLQAQVWQSEKMQAIGQLAGGVAHDFNNILTAIFGNVELLRSELSGESPAEEPLSLGLQQIEYAADRASSLTRQLLAFSRRQVVKPEVLDLNRILSQMEKMLRRLVSENITFEMLLEPDLWPVEADASQIEQVIMNLVVNAGDAMPGGGRLTLQTANVTLDETYTAAHAGMHPGWHVLLTVGDTGGGMDQQTLEQIFEPFFTTKPMGSGTGLGLPTAQGIVKQWDGHITACSEPDQGSTFKVYLPAVLTPLPQTRSVPEAQRTVTGSETILVCEDDEVICQLTARLLEDAGYTVLAAANGKHALNLVAAHDGPIDLLVSDVIMPGMDGRKLSETLTATHPNLRSLYVSGYASNVIAHYGVLDAGVELLEKPFTRSELLQRVRAVLEAEKPANVEPSLG